MTDRPSSAGPTTPVRSGRGAQAALAVLALAMGGFVIGTTARLPRRGLLLAGVAALLVSAALHLRVAGMSSPARPGASREAGRGE